MDQVIHQLYSVNILLIKQEKGYLLFASLSPLFIFATQKKTQLFDWIMF